MPDSEEEFKPIDAASKKFLKEDWLPEVRLAVKKRKPIRTLMIGVLVTTFAVLTIGAVIAVLGSDGISWGSGPTVAVFMGFAAIVFVYLGQIQACDEVMPCISLAVHRGCWNQLKKSLKKLECYGNFEGLIGHVRDIIPKQ